MTFTQRIKKAASLFKFINLGPVINRSTDNSNLLPPASVDNYELIPLPLAIMYVWIEIFALCIAAGALMALTVPDVYNSDTGRKIELLVTYVLLGAIGTSGVVALLNALRKRFRL